MLRNRVALITGSTSGIGLGIAEALAAQGCDLMLNGFGEAASIEHQRRSLAEQCKVRVLFNAADVANPHACLDLVADTQARLGSLDILVNNAGIQHVAPVEAFPAEQWGAILAVNLSSCFHTVRSALPGMKKRAWGRIINIASVHGLVASAGKCAYVAAKHGVIGLSKVVALESASSGITCNAICPGWVQTPLVQKQIEKRERRDHISQPQAERELLAEKQPSAKFTTVEQIGQMVVFLCSPAADNMTGASLTMDGGWTAQ